MKLCAKYKQLNNNNKGLPSCRDVIKCVIDKCVNCKLIAAKVACAPRGARERSHAGRTHVVL